MQSAPCGEFRGDPSAAAAWRVAVVVAGEEDPAVALSVASLGANAIATLSPPRANSAAAASRAGLRYLPRVSICEIDRLLTDGAYLAETRGIPNISGFQYVDLDVDEGYATLETQRYAYQVLKTLFPEALIVYATRLDPIATDPNYLDLYFHPEYSDLVTPYFYPVGTTVLGTQEEDDPWPDRLRALLGPLRARMSRDKPILPVLQAFEQTGHRVSRSLIRRQFEVYRELWPANGNAAVFWWGGGLAEPLVGFSPRRDLQSAVRGLFGGEASRPAPCVPPPRGLSR